MNILLLKYSRIAWHMQKLNMRKPMYTINGNAVQGHSSENYLTQKFITRNILYTTLIFAIYGIGSMVLT